MPPKKTKHKKSPLQKIARLLNWGGIRVLISVIILLIVIVYIYQPQQSVRARIQLRTAAIAFTVDTMSTERDRFNFALSSNDTIGLSFENAAPVYPSGSLRHHMPYTIMPTDSPPVVRIERMYFPNTAEVALEHDMDQVLKMNIMAGTDRHQGDSIYFRFAVSFSAGLVWNYSRNLYDTIKKGNAPFTRQFVEFQNNLSTGHSKPLFFYKPASWEWPKTLYISSLFFDKHNGTGIHPVSAIKSGTIEILDSEDPLVEVREGNLLKLGLGKPAELILKGDSAGLTVQLDAILTMLKLGNENNDLGNLMPDRIKWLHKKFGYSWGFFTFLLTLLPFVVPAKKTKA